jgi:Calcineurin-like phosphoesterase
VRRAMVLVNVLLPLALAVSATPRASAGATSVTIAAAGDIACRPTGGRFDGANPTACQFRETATAIQAEIDAGTVQEVYALGDTQYSSGASVEYAAGYDPSWGTFKAQTHPVVGNHEWRTPMASGFFDEFSSTTPDLALGRYYYSLDAGSWHVIVLDSDCIDLPGPAWNPTDGCVPGSPQMTWLRRDLANSTALCTLAIWHHPVFSSSEGGFNPTALPFWRALYDAGVDVVLNGHRHVYERFAPQRPDGTPTANGMVEFVVGSGGDDHGMLLPTMAPNEIVRDNTSFGYLKLTLSPTGYDFAFAPVAGGTFTDAGTGACH